MSTADSLETNVYGIWHWAISGQSTSLKYGHFESAIGAVEYKALRLADIVCKSRDRHHLHKFDISESARSVAAPTLHMAFCIRASASQHGERLCLPICTCCRALSVP